MTLLLSDIVLGGELIATEHYAVRGFLHLEGYDRPLLLHLTGNPSPDLVGKHLRFEANLVENPLSKPGCPLPDNVAWQQIGPTGTIAVQYGDRKTGESTSADEMPSSLHIEWYGQNGRVLVELSNPVLEFARDDEEDDEELLEALLDEDVDLLDQSEEAELDDVEFDDFSEANDFGGDSSGGAFGRRDDEDDEDPYRLFSDDLKRHFDDLSRDTDDIIGSREPQSDLERLDELLESGDGELIGEVFESPLHLPRPETLDETTVEPVLKRLLSELARFGITLDLCEHFTPMDAYTLLIEEICQEERTYPELRHTQWVQHFTTTEFCDQCTAEIEAELAEHEQCAEDLRDDLPGGDDDDLPL